MPPKPVAKVPARRAPIVAVSSTGLEAVARKHTRSAREPEPVGIGIVQRVGRKLADGTRTGAKEARRMTFYLRRDVAKELTTRAAVREMSLSDLANELFAQALGLAK